MAYKRNIVGRFEVTHMRKLRKVLIYKEKSIYHLIFFIDGERQPGNFTVTNKPMAMYEAFIFVTGMFIK